MNLVKPTSSELDIVLEKANYSSAHKFKEDMMNTSQNIAHFDVFKDIDSSDRDGYVALKAPNQYENNTYTGYTLY